MQDSKGFGFTQICGELITLSENSEIQQKKQSENFDLEKEEFDTKIKLCFRFKWCLIFIEIFLARRGTRKYLKRSQETFGINQN